MSVSFRMVALLPACLGLALARVHGGEPATVFERDVLPIMAQHCLKCHGLEAKKAGLDLRTMGLLLQGGERGPVLVPGKPQESPLFERIADRSMPPEGELPLTDEKIETVRRWIEAGAAADDAASGTTGDSPPEVSDADRQFWAFQRLRRPPVPVGAALAEQAAARTPVDAFLLARLSEQGLGFSPEADRRTLVRRLYLDLVGLPPSPDEASARIADPSPDWYERLVEALLASPHFGERWGRHWLDAAGYVDTVGADNDAAIILPAAGKWRYRDYVVRSFNQDKPASRFLLEQLAGDELADWRAAARYTPEMFDCLAATGYLRNVADRTSEDELNTADIRYAVLYDTLELVGTHLLGLTLQCARCHSHKYEPVPQTDYYKLMALFTPAYNPQAWLQPHRREGTSQKPAYRELPDVPPSQQQAIDQHNRQVDEQAAALAAQVEAVRGACRARLAGQKLAALPEALRGDTQAALATPAEKRSAVQSYLAEKLGPGLAVSAEEVQAALTADERRQIDELEARLAALNATRRAYGKLQALYDVGPPPETFLLRRGDYQNPGPPVEAGFLSVLETAEDPGRLDEAAPYSGTSGRRLALARWLTDADTPAGGLVSRVLVNRVWAQLFGRGIVPTTGNLGRSGAPPTHPELLEWLAAEFTAGGWRMKPLLRLLVSSAAYRQSSAETGAALAAARDPGNDLLWKMRLRRLEAEAVRDCLLAAGGNLNRGVGGPPLLLDPRPDGSVVLKLDQLPSSHEKWRRSLYILARRAYHLTLLDVFDQPVLAVNCTGRAPSAVVTQSLALLNDPFLVEQAGFFAQRAASAADDDEARVRAAFEIALARPPAPEETAWCLELLARQTTRFAAGLPAPEARQKALEQLCHMLLNTSEFLYIP